jgi:hypothetical protein
MRLPISSSSQRPGCSAHHLDFAGVEGGRGSHHDLSPGLMAVRSSNSQTSLCRINIRFPTLEALSSPEAIMRAKFPRLNPRRRHALSGEWTNGGQLSSTLARDTWFSFDVGRDDGQQSR